MKRSNGSEGDAADRHGIAVLSQPGMPEYADEEPEWGRFTFLAVEKQGKDSNAAYLMLVVKLMGTEMLCMQAK